MTRKSSVRLDIQALRAIAVASVVIFHVWPWSLPGGYIGVDVFFVVSGFLISGHLMREHESTGTVKLGRFWARRARRLLPAAFTVLAFTAIASWIWLPASRLSEIPKQIAASALYVENWVLAANSVDYLAAADPPTPVQHYWSLSTEEQFYLIWPLIIVVIGLLARRHSRKAILAVMSALVVASFAYSLWLTIHDPAQAYFVTPTRAWEFGAGALLALAPQLRAGPRIRASLAWAGLAIVVVSCFIITADTPFPGTAALFPVIGSILFIGARAGTERYSPLAIGKARPVQHLGDISYSVYLWHWPILIILPFALPGLSGWMTSALIIALTLAISEASFRWIETPTRSSPWLSKQPTWRMLTAALAGSFVVIAMTFPAHHAVVVRTHEARAALTYVALHPGCVGIGGDMACLKGTDIVVVPDPTVDLDHGTTACQQGGTRSVVKACATGASAEEATRTVAAIGDSHMRQWAPALVDLAKANKWRLVFILKASCPFSNAKRVVLGADSQAACNEWNSNVHDYLDDHPEISMIFTSASSRGVMVPLPGVEVTAADRSAANAAKTAFPASRGTTEDELAAGIAGARASWAELPPSVTSVVVIRDVPRPDVGVQDCLVVATDDQLRQSAPECTLSRTEALLPDPLTAAVPLAEPRVHLVDFSDQICSSDTCAVIINGAGVYRDGEHMTTIFARSASEELGDAIAAAVAAG